MTKLYKVTYLMTALFAVYLIFNVLEFTYHLNLFYIKQPFFILDYFYLKLKIVHNILDVIGLVLDFVFLLLFTHFLFNFFAVKKVHWGIILLSMVPVIHYFLYFPILRKMNRSFFQQVNRNPKRTDTLIFTSWLIVLGYVGVGLLAALYVTYAYKNGFISSPDLIYGKFNLIATEVMRLCFSISMGLYYLNLLRELKHLNKPDSEVWIEEDSLLDVN